MEEAVYSNKIGCVMQYDEHYLGRQFVEDIHILMATSLPAQGSRKGGETVQLCLSRELQGMKTGKGLCRPNKELVLETTGILCNRRKETAGKDLGAMKGVTGSRFDAILDAYR